MQADMHRDVAGGPVRMTVESIYLTKSRMAPSHPRNAYAPHPRSVSSAKVGERTSSLARLSLRQVPERDVTRSVTALHIATRPSCSIIAFLSSLLPPSPPARCQHPPRRQRPLLLPIPTRPLGCRLVPGYGRSWRCASAVLGCVSASSPLSTQNLKFPSRPGHLHRSLTYLPL